MPTRRTHQRSSDSVDFEHTATLQEMEELTLMDKDHTDLSPQSTPGTQIASTAIASAHATEDTPREPEPPTSTKLPVFRDAHKDTTSPTPLSTPHPIPPPPTCPRSDSTAHTSPFSTTLTSARLTRTKYFDLPPNPDRVSRYKELLKDIAAKRAFLLSALKDLEQEEAVIVGMLGELGGHTAATYPSIGQALWRDT